MEQSPSCEASRHLTSPKIPRIWCKSNVHYSTHKSPPPVHTLRRVNPVLSPFHFLKVHCNIIIPRTPKSSKWSVYLKCPNQNPVCTSPVSHTCHMLRPPHTFWVDARPIYHDDDEDDNDDNKIIIFQFNPIWLVCRHNSHRGKQFSSLRPKCWHNNHKTRCTNIRERTSAG